MVVRSSCAVAVASAGNSSRRIARMAFTQRTKEVDVGVDDHAVGHGTRPSDAYPVFVNGHDAFPEASEGEAVTAHEDEIGTLSDVDASDLVVETEQLCCILRGRENDVGCRHARLLEQFEFPKIFPVGGDAGVGAHGDADTRRQCPLEGALMVLDCMLLLAQRRLVECRPSLGSAEHAAARAERRNQERAALDHQLDGLVVEIDAVFDRSDPGTHGRLDACCPEGVGHDRETCGVCFVDDRA